MSDSGRKEIYIAATAFVVIRHNSTLAIEVNLFVHCS